MADLEMRIERPTRGCLPTGSARLHATGVTLVDVAMMYGTVEGMSRNQLDQLYMMADNDSDRRALRSAYFEARARARYSRDGSSSTSFRQTGG